MPHSIEGYARWLIAFVDALGLTGKAVVLGHSFGSIISSQAIVLGLDTPRLILINPIAISGLEGPKPHRDPAHRASTTGSPGGCPRRLGSVPAQATG